MADLHPDSESHGFGHSPRRIATELGIIVGAIALIAGLVVWGAGSLAAALVPYISPELDRKLGEASWQSPTLALERCTNPEAVEYVKGLSAPLLDALEDPPFTFEFQVVSSEEVNAFALPGGFVTVNMGLLDKAESGDEVAAVIAHEIQHALLRHGTRRILRRMGGVAALSWIFGGTGIEAPANLIGELSNLHYDREQESEADREGLLLMKRANIDPRGMSHFFTRMESMSKLTPPALISTHPDPGDRAQAAEAAAAGGGPWRALPSPKGIKCN
jgi:predicted Zn-dependent protease